MKRWLARIGVVMAVILVVLLAAAFWSEGDSQKLTGHLRNEQVSVIKDGWPGNPVDQYGRFMNDEFPFMIKMSSLLKWQLGTNPFKEEKRNDSARLEVKDPTEFLASDRDGILWLGHASFYIRLNGVGLLLDPVFGDPRFLRRYVEVPSPLEKIRSVDYVLVSHDHRDHADEATLIAIAQKFPDAKFLGGLRMDEFFDFGDSSLKRAYATGWFQPFDINDDRLKIYFLPTRHWSRRGLFDTNWRLWGSFVIQTDKAAMYFGGDSGYGRHYREIGELFPKIDYFLIGIGAYEPRWFMEPHHNNPSDAVKAFIDSRAKTLVPMHYGTFDLSDEPPSTPLRTLLEEAKKTGIADRVRVVTIGESIPLD